MPRTQINDKFVPSGAPDILTMQAPDTSNGDLFLSSGGTGRLVAMNTDGTNSGTVTISNDGWECVKTLAAGELAVFPICPAELFGTDLKVDVTGAAGDNIKLCMMVV